MSMSLTLTHDKPLSTPGGSATPITARHWTGADPASSWPATATSLVGPLAERAAEHDRSGHFVHDGFLLLRQHRFFSMLVPAELGGGGASYAEACAVLSELARGCPATSLALSMHTHLVAAQVWRYRRGLPAPALTKVANDQAVLISTGAADWINSSGSAQRVDGGFRLSAVKTPASACPAGNVLATSVRWDEGPEGPQVIHASVPFTAEGVTITETWDSMGMRATGSHTVVLDNVFVPDEAVALIRPAGKWHPVWNTVLGVAMPVIMASYVGVAEAAAAQAIEIASVRATRPDHPEVAPLVGRMLNQLTVARDTVRAMIEACDDLDFDNTEAHAAATLTRKTNTAEAVLVVARLALEIGGGNAYAIGGGIERLFRDLHGALYHPLPAAQQERFTGRLALGFDPLSFPGS